MAEASGAVIQLFVCPLSNGCCALLLMQSAFYTILKILIGLKALRICSATGLEEAKAQRLLSNLQPRIKWPRFSPPDPTPSLAQPTWLFRLSILLFQQSPRLNKKLQSKLIKLNLHARATSKEPNLLKRKPGYLQALMPSIPLTTNRFPSGLLIMC